MKARFFFRNCLPAVLAVAAVLAAAQAACALRSYEEARAAYRPSEAYLTDRRGHILHELRADPRARRLGWTRLADMSPTLRQAVVRAEDRRFFEHGGVDYRALAAAVAGAAFSDRLRGASTISMQLAAMLAENPSTFRGRRSIRQKWLQIQAAWELEERWSKEQILEAYLNLIFFRGEFQGVEAAARGLYGKAPHGLNAAEALVLAALIRAPNAQPEQVVRRAGRLGQALGWPVAEGELVENAGRARAAAIVPRVHLAAHAARRLLRGQAPGVEAGSTLDIDIQRFAGERLVHHLDALRSRNVRDGAVLVVDNASGDVLAYVSHAGDPARARFVDGVQAKRQAGSTLKPFLYTLAFDRRMLTPASVLEDSPLDVPGPTGIYQPRNYDGDFKGPVPVRAALGSSLNIPAVRVAEMVGVESFLRLLRELGIQGLTEPGEFYGPALALGTADVTLWELTDAYRTLANGGLRTALRLSAEERTAGSGARVVSAPSAFLIADILSDRQARQLSFGLENALATRFWTAVKTGTSKDMRDNWCIGYSRVFTVGVWVGNFSGEPMWDVSGLAGAAPLWLEVMNRLHPDGVTPPPDPPPGLVHAAAPAGAGAQPQWFIRGTEPVSVAAGAPAAVPRIVYPAPGAVFALDPDIPPEHQRIFFAAQGETAGLHWVLDGRRLAPGSRTTGWFPAPGNHRLLLQGADGRAVDSVSFQVRGIGRR